MSGFSDDMPFFDEPREAAPVRKPGGIAARAIAARSGPTDARAIWKG